MVMPASVSIARSACQSRCELAPRSLGTTHFENSMHPVCDLRSSSFGGVIRSWAPNVVQGSSEGPSTLTMLAMYAGCMDTFPKLPIASGCLFLPARQILTMKLHSSPDWAFWGKGEKFHASPIRPETLGFSTLSGVYGDESKTGDTSNSGVSCCHVGPTRECCMLRRGELWLLWRRSRSYGLRSRWWC